MQLPSLSDLKNKHILALLGNFVIAGVSFGMMALLARAMNKPDLGVWFYFLMIYGFADSVRNGLLLTATVKFYSGTPPQRANEILGSVWFLALVLTGLLGLVNLAALPFVGYIQNHEYVVLVQWFGLTVLSSLPFNITFWIMVADNEYGKILWLRMVNNGTMIITIGILYFLHKATLENVLLVNFATNVLTSLICLALGYSRIGTLLKRTNAATMEVFNFGKFSLASNVSSYLLGMANGQILVSVLDTSALAVYTIGTKLMEVIEIPLRSFVGTGMSAMATAYNNNNKYHLTFVSKKYPGMLTLVFIPIAIITFFGADLGIWILGGKDYLSTAAPNILRIMMFIAILYPIDRFNGVTLDIIHQPKVNLYKVITMGTVNIVVAFVAVSMLKNVYGIVIAVFCATIAGLAVGYYHLRKHLDYSLRGIIVLGVVEMENFFNEKIMKRPPANTSIDGIKNVAVKYSKIDYNEYFEKDSIDGTPIVSLKLGDINLPSGQIIACDPLVSITDTEPFNKAVKPGVFPVTAYIAKTEKAGDRYAVVKLDFQSNSRAIKWELAVINDKDLENLNEDDAFVGFGVDAGLGCFLDAETQSAYEIFEGDFYAKHSGENLYDDFFADKFKENANPNDPDDVGDWLNFYIPQQPDLNVIMFHSGYGDGVYPCYWGIDDNNEICSLVVDFIVL